MPTKAQIAAYLSVEPGEIMETAMRENGQVVVIYSDYRKVVIPAGTFDKPQPDGDKSAKTKGGR